MQTQKQNVIFDVREYSAKLPREQRRIKADNESITATLTFKAGELPEPFKVNGKPDELVCRAYQSRDARQNNASADRIAVKFKVGANCKWFDKYGQSTTRPTNADLDTKRYEVVIDYVRKEKNPNDALAPSGYWVNAIMFAEIEDNPFANNPMETAPAAAQAQATTAQAPSAPQASEAETETADDLPF